MSRLRRGALLVPDAVFPERLDRPLARIFVALHDVDTVGLEQAAELVDHGLGRERRPHLAERVQHDNAIHPPMRDCQREAVR